jgi:hypothetical protein
MSDREWFTVATGMTNTVPNSCVEVLVNTSRICPNMSNAQFRALILRIKEKATYLVQRRAAALAVWDRAEQARVQFWFGISDAATRDYLRAGLPRLLTAMGEIKPENVIRWDEAEQRNITCTVLPDNGATDAAVCKPDSARRIISIYRHFCTSPEDEFWHGNQVLTFIHECTHFTDVFDSEDNMYGVTKGMTMWAQREPEKALRNADSIACYIGYADS